MTELTLEKRIDDLEQLCIKDLASEVEHQGLFNTVTDLEKRVENLEKMYLMLQECNAFEKVYGKEEKNCKYHFKIEEHESCYTLNKIVFNKKYHHPSIATIWFSDFNNDMLSKEKAYEIIQNIKKHLEEVEE